MVESGSGPGICPSVTRSLPEPEPCCWGAAELETARLMGGRALAGGVRAGGRWGAGWGGWGAGWGRPRGAKRPQSPEPPEGLARRSWAAKLRQPLQGSEPPGQQAGPQLRLWVTLGTEAPTCAASLQSTPDRQTAHPQRLLSKSQGLRVRSGWPL